MAKNRIEIFIVRVESVKKPETLSCHVHLYNKLYDVMAPLSHNNKENKVLVPIGALVAFQIKTLEKVPKTLFSVVFNTQILLTQTHCWMPLFVTPQEVKSTSNEIQGPRLFLTIKASDEETTTCTPDLSVTPEPFSNEHKNYYEEVIHSKDQEIQKLQQEINALKETNSVTHVLEIANKNIDPVEVFLNIYLARNHIEGLIVKHKGNLYKYGTNFVEIALKDKYLCCRTDSKWSLLEEFIASHCGKELEQIFDCRTLTGIRSNNSSKKTSPRRFPIRSEHQSVEKTKHRRSESFQNLLKPTKSVLNKQTIPTKRSPFRC